MFIVRHKCKHQQKTANNWSRFGQRTSPTFWKGTIHILRNLLSPSTGFLNNQVCKIQLDELDFLSISNLNFTACVACKTQVQNRQKFKLDFSKSRADQWWVRVPFARLITYFCNFVFSFLSLRLRDFPYYVFRLRGKTGKTKWKINKLLCSLLVTSMPKITKNKVTKMG